MKVETLKQLLDKQHGPAQNRGWGMHLLALDPGLTTGWAEFLDGALLNCGQVAGEFVLLEHLILQKRPARVICEAYAIYPWKLRSQSWSDCPVPQMIGVIRFVCQRACIPIKLRGANFTKAFFTDKKLKELGLFQAGKRHANDAIRLGASWLMFGGEEKL